MARGLSFLEKLRATAMQKHAAAQARSDPDREAEKPREIIMAAIGEISQGLETDGFKFVPSGPAFKRASGDLTYEIRFQSDRNNIAGQRAAVWIHANVGSKRLTEWRRAGSWPPMDANSKHQGWFAGGQIGNLVKPFTWIEWDFADPQRRQEQIGDALYTIRTIALPFFALFDDPKAAIEHALRETSVHVPALVEYGLAVLGHEASAAIVQSYLRACHPDIRADFAESRIAFARDELPQFVRGFGHDLAALELSRGLDFGPVD